tara:strand:- start:445 stop:582 length:138 start_codon:yes stop_codon:yes gene_type:complete
MIKIIMGIVIGICIVKFGLLPDILNFLNESGATDKAIDTLEGLKS